MNILFAFFLTAFNLGNNQVEIRNDDYSAQIKFYNPQGTIIDQITIDNIYGYKIAPKGKYLYILNNDGINIYDENGRMHKRIKDKGMFVVSPRDEYLVCASEDIVRVYSDSKFFFNMKVKSTAIRRFVFDNDNKYLGIMARNNFSLISLNDKQILWIKNFPTPLIFCKIADNKIILVTEDRASLTGNVYIYSLAGEMIQNYDFHYQQYDEQIQDIEILHKGVKAKTHLREWEVGEADLQKEQISLRAIAKQSPENTIVAFGNSAKTKSNADLLYDSIPWPLPATNSFHCLGNNWFEYQNYGGSAYFHPGIDIITPGDSGVPVYAVKQGVVKAWLTIGGTIFWRLGVADSSLSYTDSCNGYLYAHIDSARFHKNVGDTVNIGDLIGYLVPWPVPGFNHCHFAKIRDRGSTWNTADWVFVFNPLISLTPNQDSIPPIFENALTNQKFAFARNNTSTYLSSNSLNGNVDIIAKIYDKLGISSGDTIWDQLIPLKIEYEIIGPSVSQPRKLSFIFSGRIPTSSSLVSVVYKQDNTCESHGDYDYRDYYFIVTNTDGDSIIESSDASFSWQTTNFPGGRYWVKIYAYDTKNNVSVCSMQVTVNNAIGITEHENHFQSSFNKIRNIKGFYNSVGQKVKYQKLKPGIYFYQENDSMHKLLIIKPTTFLIN